MMFPKSIIRKMTEETTHCKLVAKKDGIYTVYVFREDSGKLRMCTKLPNWGPYDLKIGDKGYLTTQFFKSGEKFFDRETESERVISFTNLYFKEFVYDNPTTNSDQVLL